MKIKFSHIALAVIASSSFSAVAETLVGGASVTAEENIILTDTSTLGLTITAIPNLTVAKVKEGEKTNVAKFKLTGTNAAVKLVNAYAKDKYCSLLVGTNDPANKLEVCLRNTGITGAFDVGADRYYKYNEGEYFLRSTNNNINRPTIAADSYKVTMEAAQYVL